MLKRLAASLFEAFGLELRRVPPAVSRDPFLYLSAALRSVPAPVVFDVGANVGQSIARFRRVWPRAVIHAFEPGRSPFAELERRTAGAPSIHLHHAALGASAGSREFQENSHADMSSFLNPATAAWGRIVDRYTVPITTVDLYRSAHSIPQVDILKIDTQGFDLQVLKGARGSFEDQAIRFVLLELIFGDLYEGQGRVDDLFRLLLDQRMELVGIYDLHFVHDRAGWADALFAAAPPTTGPGRADNQL